MNDSISLKGVRTHNLKSVDVTIPHGTFVVVTGLSGSGKSSLAFDTLYAEGRRRYVESLSTYSRQFLERIEKPDLGFVSGILPAIAIEAKNIITNARSTVGTQTELNDYVRLLFSRIGKTFCFGCGEMIEADTAGSVFKKIQDLEGKNILVGFQLELTKKARQYQKEILDELEKQGFLIFWAKGACLGLEELRKIKNDEMGCLLVVVDQLIFNEQNKGRLIDSLESTFKFGKGTIWVISGKSERKFSNRFHCASCNIDYRPPDPNMFSFNSPLGACPECQGFGRIITIDKNLVVPNPNLSIEEGVIEPFTKPSCKWEFKQLKEFCKKKKIPINIPFSKLKEEQRKWILEGSDDKNFFSVKHFF